MAAMDNTLAARYLTQQVVRQRNSITLNNWASYVATSPVPDNPDSTWIRERIVAEQIPLQLELTVLQTLAYFLQDPAVPENIKAFISSDNDTATEQDLSQKNQNIVGTFMARYALSTVTQTQIDQWKQRNGLATPVASQSPIAPPSYMPPPPPAQQAAPAQSPPSTPSAHSTSHGGWFSGGHKQS